jgi:hypothetical protein
MSAPARLLLSGYCICQCHTDETSDTSPPVRRTAGERGVMAVDPGSPRHAVMACDTCRDHHCAALSGRPPELAYRAGAPTAPTPAAPATPRPGAPAAGDASDAADRPSSSS